ncbi:MAG: ctaE [Phycisphaerales bacterium]|nr:ctaE [Phycisphaerales bacterium]
MSNAAINPVAAAVAAGNHDAHAGHHHDPHLAHHFDTPEQQMASGKLGMWLFLGTELLMFGGLFCAYAVYRHNHPEVFQYAHQFLNRTLGAVNTVVLITSSLTMAWGVRCAQLGQQRALRILLAFTLLGGFGFLGIKAIEYRAKFEHDLWIGSGNKFNYQFDPAKAHHHEEGGEAEGAEKKAETPKETAAGAPVAAAAGAEAKPAGAAANAALIPADPNIDSPDEAKIKPNFADPPGLARKVIEQHESEMKLSELPPSERSRLYTFFGVYFFMTGLHGLHVVIGMALITWILIRAVGPRQIPWVIPMIPASICLFLAYLGLITDSQWLMIVGFAGVLLCVLWIMVWVPRRKHASTEGQFGPTYFAPVDLVGLYWHLVDLIWIFLFPLLYLIH